MGCVSWFQIPQGPSHRAHWLRFLLHENKPKGKGKAFEPNLHFWLRAANFRWCKTINHPLIFGGINHKQEATSKTHEVFATKRLKGVENDAELTQRSAFEVERDGIGGFILNSLEGTNISRFRKRKIIFKSAAWAGIWTRFHESKYGGRFLANRNFFTNVFGYFSLWCTPSFICKVVKSGDPPDAGRWPMWNWSPTKISPSPYHFWETESLQIQKSGLLHF